VECIQLFDLFALPVENSLIDGVWHAVVDELGEDETVTTRIEHFESVEGEWEEVTDIRIACEDCIDV
jgi:hypothetical protein